MAKTNYTGENVTDFINSYVDNEQKKADSFHLIELMKEWSSAEPEMWGPTIIGFGNYHYKYASGREGDWFVCGFSPRKHGLSVYLMCDLQKPSVLLKNLGKFKMGKSCLNIKTLADIDLNVLEKLIIHTLQKTKEQ